MGMATRLPACHLTTNWQLLSEKMKTRSKTQKYSVHKCE